MKIIIVLLLLVGAAHAATRAVTEDGRAVLLETNGTWTIERATLGRTEYAFRKAKWGMSRKDVKKSEKSKLEKETKTALVYSDRVAGMSALVFYLFVEDKLVICKYVILEKHTNSNDHINDYKRVRSALNEKYGTPVTDKEIWRNDLYKETPSSWGTAVSIGHLVYIASWATEETDIAVMLNGENFKANLVAEYASKLLAPLVKTSVEKEDKAAF